MENLNVLQAPLHDTSVIKYEYHTYSPLFQNSYARSDEIRIPIPNQDAFILPCKSFLYIEGKIDNSTKPDNVKLSKNFVSYMFEEMRVELGGITISTCRNPGLVSSMKYYLTMNRNELSNSAKYGWFTDDGVSITKGTTFNIIIPCKNLMGFFEDFKNVLINMKFELVLIRAKNEENCHNTVVMNTAGTAPEPGANIAVKININKINLKMPHLYLADIAKLEILKFVDKAHHFPIFFRAWDFIEQPVQAGNKSQSWTIRTTSLLERPRYVIVGFQTKRKNQPSVNYSNFDHCSITNMKLFLNSNFYPYNNWNLNFDTDQFALAYHYFTEFGKSYYYNENHSPVISANEYKSTAPLFVFNCLHQEESIKSGSISMRLEFESLADFPAETICNIVIIHDRVINYCPLDGTVNLLV